MTKPRKYDNIHGFAGDKDLTLLERGRTFPKLQQEDFDTPFGKSESVARPSCRNTTLSLQIPYENFIEAEIM